MKRQHVRKLTLLLSLLLFPVTLYYFSPAVILTAGLEGVINGSFLVFLLLLLGSLFFGRVFCAFLCPAGGIQECASTVSGKPWKPCKQGWRNRIKYIIWGLWLAGVAACYLFRGEIVRVDFLFETEAGVSVTNLYGYVIYYGVVLLVLVPALLCGKRAFCHYFCWMAPFMAVGEKLGRLLHFPQLHISADREKCVSCGQCSRQCPMGLGAADMARAGSFRNTECIQCGVCVDACPKGALSYRMKREDGKHGDGKKDGLCDSGASEPRAADRLRD